MITKHKSYQRGEMIFINKNYGYEYSKYKQSCKLKLFDNLLIKIVKDLKSDIILSYCMFAINF